MPGPAAWMRFPHIRRTLGPLYGSHRHEMLDRGSRLEH